LAALIAGWGIVSEPVTHRVLPFDGVEAYLAGAVPFLREGVDAGDRVMVVAPPASRSVLQDALGAAADAIEFPEPAEWYAHPARTLADCLGDAEAATWEGRRLRLLGEPGWTGGSPLEVVEWQRVEALANVAFEGTGAAILCAYSRTLPAGIIAASRQTHPETVKGTAVVETPGYMDPWAFSERCDGVPLTDPPAEADRVRLDRPDLFWLRRYVTDYAHQARLPDEHLQRLLVAVTEVVTNAVRHGAPPIVLTMWTDLDDRSLVCQVTDHGRWEAGADAGLLPPHGADRAGADVPGRFGLWAVRLLCSVVQIRTGEHGTTVRLRLRLPAVTTDSGTALPL
jgi:MEDS: MEthanogen/methylotroph, DcmR Sensory domain/Histidine kinase-like ATPase domain